MSRMAPLCRDDGAVAPRRAWPYGSIANFRVGCSILFLVDCLRVFPHRSTDKPTW